MKGAIAKAEEIAAENPNSWIPAQFDNVANIDAHRKIQRKNFSPTFRKVSTT